MVRLQNENLEYPRNRSHFDGFAPSRLFLFIWLSLLENQREGANPFYINQGIQLVGFHIIGYSFVYAPCFFLTAGVDLTDSLKFTLNWGIFDFFINFNTQSEVISIDFNIIAILIFVWLVKINNRITVEKEAMTDTRFL